MSILLWGYPYLMYLTLAVGLVAAVFIGLSLQWLRDNPVLPLNWNYEQKYRQPTRSVNYYQEVGPILAATATSAYAITHQPYVVRR
jgi:hypothetical protein